MTTGGKAPAPPRSGFFRGRRLGLFFGARYLLPLLALVALSVRPDLEIDRTRFASLLTAHVIIALALHLLATRRPPALPVAIWASLVADVVVVGALAAATGGARSPLVFLYTLSAISAGVLLSAATGVRMLLLSTGAIVALDIAGAQGLLGDLGTAGAEMGLEAVTALWILGGAATVFSAFNERELKRRNAELAMVQQIALDIENTLTLQTVLDHLLRGVVERFGFDAAAALLVEEDEGPLRCVALHGATGARDTLVQRRGPIAEALSRQQPRTVPSEEARRDGVLADVLGSRGYAAVPLGDAGVLVVTRAGRKGRGGVVRGHEIEALTRVAHHASLAIANARLHARVSAMAVTDPLTGLANHGEFQRALAAEAGRLSRYKSLRAEGHRLSLLLIDVDHFKRYNDRYGHPAGDALLRGIAAATKQAVRSFDIVARYGGDELAVILPETDREGALRVAERIIETLAAAPLEIPEDSMKPLKVGLSIGAATAPENGTAPAALVEAADRALYRSKEAGRGRYAHASDAGSRGATVIPLRRGGATRRRRAGAGAPARAASRRARERSSLPRRRTPRG